MSEKAAERNIEEDPNSAAVDAWRHPVEQAPDAQPKADTQDAGGNPPRHANNPDEPPGQANKPPEAEPKAAAKKG